MTDSKLAGGAPAHGAYGIGFRGLADAQPVLNPAASDWPSWHVDYRQANPAEVDDLRGTPESLKDGRAVLKPSTGVVRLRLETRQIEARSYNALGAMTVVHPMLSGAAAIIAWWARDLAFHAGSFAAESGEAWIVIGGRGSGKSTTMAALSKAGAHVLADDLSVVRRGAVMAGPRCIDLRTSAAPTAPEATPLGIVGDRERWRVRLDAVPVSCAVAGFVYLDWGSSVALERVDPSAALQLLMRALMVSVAPQDAGPLLELAARPVYRLERPQEPSTLAPAVDQLLSL